jgi:hypothetical protein
MFGTFIQPSVAQILHCEDCGGPIHEVRLRWRDAPATYVDAPEEVQAKVLGAIDHSIKKDVGTCNNRSENPWYCSSEKGRYFQGVGGLGQPVIEGLVCRNDAKIPKQKFYREDFLAEYHCVRFFEDQGSIQIDIDWEP